MMEVLNSLDAVSTGYCVFEKDQILTHEHLNDLAGYFDDQDRLTRITLLGAGIAFGLNASTKGGKVTISKGVGVTTDGDLLRLTEDTTFQYYKPRGADAPFYAPFAGVKALGFELVASSDPLAVNLSEFTAKTGLNLADLVAVLFMESYVKDEDACSGTDCDNKGQNATHTPKVLLFEKTITSRLKENFTTMESAARALEPLFADRAVLTESVTTAAKLAQAYRQACNNIHAKLVVQLPKVISACGPLLQGVFTADPTAAWKSALTAAKSTFATSGTGIQYYYDFLKDLVDTYNALRECLYGDTFVCCPPPAAFPKHLLAGPLSGVVSAPTRTGFYPSPAVSQSVERWRRARALAKTLDTLIRAFKVPSGGTIAVIPSHYEDRPLEDRAIPWYYQATGRISPHRDWNYTQTQRGLERYLYSYHAPAAGALGAAAAPLTAQIAPFPFFRIEGCLGMDAEEALETLETTIAAYNLPFDVRAVALGTSTTNVKVAPTRYSDLHRLHQVLRTDLSSQLDQVKTFGTTLKSGVEEAIDDSTIEEEEASTVAGIKTSATDASDDVVAKAAAAKTKVSAPSYSAFAQDDSWKTDVTAAVTAAGKFKSDIGANLRTDFPTPFDSIISNSTANVLSWLGEVIADKDEKANEKLLLPTFIAEHPSVEHAAGVLRGGTFVLIYDTAGLVVGDLMLPYRWPDDETETEEPTLSTPTIKSDFLSKRGAKPTSTVTSTVKKEWTSALSSSSRLFSAFRTTSE